MAILLLDNYDSFTYNLYHQVQHLTSTPVHVYRHDAISMQELETLRPQKIILSPGPGHPNNAADRGIGLELIHYAISRHLPLLGVCFGHQLLVHSLGGTIIPANNVLHGKTSFIHLFHPSKLFNGVTSPVSVMRYHSLIAETASLPTCFNITAVTQADEQAIMAVEHQTLPFFGVQFHPESIGTPQGDYIIQNFLAL